MRHPHLTHRELTLAAIDDIIGCGKRQDWTPRRTASITDPALAANVLRVCQAYIADSYAQRYHFRKYYAE